MTAEEFAQMPNCNLAESIHNNDGDLYVAIVDDHMRAFFQVLAYHQFLKGGIGGDGPSKEELKLRCAQCRAQRTSDPAVLQKVLLDMHAGRNYVLVVPTSRVPRFSVRGNASPTIPLEQTMIPTTPTLSTSVAPVSLKEPQDLMHHLCPPSSRSPPRQCSRFHRARGFRHVIVVQESEVDEKLWHIAHVLYNYSKVCWAMHAVTKKKCTTKIVSNSNSTPAPAYLGVWNYYKFTTPKSEKFFFCPDDIERCVKGSRRKWIDKFSVDQERPPIPPVWPVKLGTNLTRPEILKLENAGFQLPQKERITPTRLLNTSAPPLDLSGVDVPTNPDSYPSSRQSKATRRSAIAPSAKQMQIVASARAMDMTILKVTMIPRPGFGCVLTLQSKPAPTQSIYQLTVSSLPECNCPAFIDMISKFGRKRNPFLHCKHLYFVFVKVSNADPEVDLFIHAPTFSFNEVKFILEGGLLTHSTS